MGEIWSQIPLAFEEVNSRRRPRTPLLPKIRAVAEIPAGSQGVFGWVAIDTDAAPDAGLLPPIDLLQKRLEEAAEGRASLRPNAAGFISHPMKDGFIRGFESTGFDGSSSPIMRCVCDRFVVVERGSEVVNLRVPRSHSRPEASLETGPLVPKVVRT